MLDTLLGVVVGGVITAVCSLYIQSRAARMSSRLQIYSELIDQVRLDSTATRSIEIAKEVMARIRHHAVLLRRNELQAILHADDLLSKIQLYSLEEAREGVDRGPEMTELMNSFNSQLNLCENLIIHQLRRPT
jgi:hypothetical protein